MKRKIFSKVLAVGLAVLMLITTLFTTRILISVSAYDIMYPMNECCPI